jgi:hypothetical protein
MVRTAGTMLARSSTKSIRPDSILSSRQAGELGYHWLPPGHRGGRQVRVKRLAVVALLRRVHLEEAAAAGKLRRHVRDLDPVVALADALRVVVVGQQVRAAGELEDLAVPAGHPVTAVLVGPRDRAPAVQVVGDLLEVGAVGGRVPVEVDPVPRAVLAHAAHHLRFLASYGETVGHDMLHCPVSV